MSLHLIKLCVGTQSVEDLERWRDRIAPGDRLSYHDTRMSPKRADELREGGSLYWVIKRVIQCRQAILDLEEIVSADGVKRCRIWLGREIVRTAPRPRKAFQGWRYLKASEAPPDLGPGVEGGEELPDELRRKLIELGAW